MTNHKTDFATMIAGRLRDAEHALDQALSDVALLSHDFTRHRADAGFAPQSGHQAFLDIQAGVAAMTEARTRLIAAHDRFAREAKVLGVQWTATGPWEQKPKPPTGTKMPVAG
jgi:hypothetical protein